MKKLIDELKALKPSTDELFGFDWGYALGQSEGIDLSIQIVRAHNPWHEVTEFPPLDSFMSNANISIDALLTDGVNCVVGYYDFDEAKWFSDGYEHTFTHWTYLPTAKP